MSSISYSIEMPDITVDTAPIAKVCALAMEGLVLDGFDRSVDPYGTPWAEIQRDGQILVDNGLLRQSVKSYAYGTDAGVTIGQEYASFHQEGTRRMPARKMVPDEGSPSRQWDDEIVAVVEDALEVMVK